MICQRCEDVIGGDVPPNRKYCDSCKGEVLREQQRAHKQRMQMVRRSNQKPLNIVCQYCHKLIDGTKQRVTNSTKYHKDCAKAAMNRRAGRRQFAKRMGRPKVVKEWNPTPAQIEAFKREVKSKHVGNVCPGHWEQDRNEARRMAQGRKKYER